jgi:large subunit ribosomal protein L22
MAEGTKKEFKVSARNVRMSARKARLVMDAVRGRAANEAVVLLQFVNRRSAPAIKKLIESAVANAEDYGNRSGVDIETDSLVVAEARVDEGPRMKRWRPRSRGMANPFTRYTCHLHVTLAEPEYLVERAKGRPAFAKPRKRMSKEERMIKTGKAPAPADKAEKKAEKKSEKKAEVKAEKKAEPKAAKPAAESKAEKKPAAKKTETKKKAADKKPAAKKSTKKATDSKKKD